MGVINYLDFDLLLERSEEGYAVRVLNSPAGQVTASFRLPFSGLELENFWLRVGRPRRGVRRLESPEMEAARTFGGCLFEAVFSGTVRGCLHSSLDEAHRQGAGLRVRLHLTDTPELADLPWEYLHNPALNRFLSLSVETPLVRYLDLPERIRPLAVEPPLRLLVMLSSPSDYRSLNVEEEWEKLKKALGDLQQRGLVVLERLEAATLSVLQKRLRRGECHIFHFIGHGAFDERAQDGVLVLEDSQGRGRPVSGHDLGTLLHDHRPLRLAVLNACEGARASRSDPFAGTAQSLVQQGIPAVIAMQSEVTDEAAITLAREFYGALADGYPVDAALAEARKAVFARGNDVEWGTPVLHMRSPDGMLFDIRRQKAETHEAAKPQAIQPSLPSPPPAPKPARLGGVWGWLRSLPSLAWIGLVLVLVLAGIILSGVLGRGEFPGTPMPLATSAAATTTLRTPVPKAVGVVTATATSTSAPTPTPLPTVEPVAPDEYMVLVAQLEPLGVLERDVARFVVDDLVQVLEVEAPFSSVSIREHPGVVTSAQAAQAMAKANGATVVIWGNYTPGFIELEVQAGVTNAFPLIQVPRERLQRTANVRVRMTDERRESVAPQVLAALAVLQWANGDAYEAACTVATLDEIEVTSAEVMGDSVAAHVHRAFESYLSDTSRAIEGLDAALALDAGNPILYLYRGGMRQRLGLYDGARRDLETALRLGPTQWVAPLWGLAMDASLFSAHLDEAISYLDQIVELRPEDWFAVNYRGALHYLKGEYDLAKADYERAIALGPETNWPFAFSTMIALHEGRMADAVALMDTALTEFPDPSFANRVTLAMYGEECPVIHVPALSAFANLALGQYDAVVRDTNDALAINDQLADLYLMQGFACCNLHDYPAAEAAYTAGLELDPGFVVLYLLRADVRLHQQDLTSAFEDLGAVRDSELGEAFAKYIEAAISGELSCENFFQQ